ncbi:MAG: LysR family transcriptional regulator [Alphaproteobacteria bacterium]|nr:LysR family transcriptional regulator [Alphaproteobacteria bacterium]MCZ6844534.1 LysR family transcriptional regulator [Alphaproteobacteria bacterium]
MKDSLRPGLDITVRVTVDADRTIGFMGDDFRVYATPSMVLDIERTCKELLDEHLDDGENSVGARVEIDHLGATLLDMWVDVHAQVAEIDRRRVLFEVEVHDQLGDKVGACQHTRFVVDLAKQKERLDAKRARLTGD